MDDNYQLAVGFYARHGIGFSRVEFICVGIKGLKLVKQTAARRGVACLVNATICPVECLSCTKSLLM